MSVLRSYRLLLEWQTRRLKGFLPLAIVVQALFALGIVAGYPMLFPQMDRLTILFLATGAPTITLITMGVVANMDNSPESPEVQYWIGRWHQSINKNFYECSLEIFEALGHGYVEDPQFNAFYEKIQPGLAAFMDKAMTYYCKLKRS